jgi:large subunit ribosomal protein L13
MNTFSLKQAQINKEWLVIDATDLVVGRLASIVANILRGKHKATYTPHMDCGDYVIIINADKIHLSGKKLTDRLGKIYYWHTGFMGGIKETNAKRIMSGKFPERILELAIGRMLTKNPLGRKHVRNLFIYSGPNHPHAAQQPKVFDVSALNNKNSKR